MLCARPFYRDACRQGAFPPLSLVGWGSWVRSSGSPTPARTALRPSVKSAPALEVSDAISEQKCHSEDTAPHLGAGTVFGAWMGAGDFLMSPTVILGAPRTLCPGPLASSLGVGAASCLQRPGRQCQGVGGGGRNPCPPTERGPATQPTTCVAHVDSLFRKSCKAQSSPNALIFQEKIKIQIFKYNRLILC